MAPSLEARTRNLIARFADYLQAFGETPAFNDEQLSAHVETLALRARLGSAQAAASSAEFARALRRTLELWRMNTRAAKLVSPAAFEELHMNDRGPCGPADAGQPALLEGALAGVGTPTDPSPNLSTEVR